MLVSADIKSALRSFRFSYADPMDLYARYTNTGEFAEPNGMNKCLAGEGIPPINSPPRTLAYLSFNDLVQRNNALDLLGNKRAEYGWEYPEIIDWLDKSADRISNYNFDCAIKAGGPIDLEHEQSTQASVLQSAAAYWEAKAKRFGAPPRAYAESPFSDETDLKAIELFCKAKIAYTKARQVFPGTERSGQKLVASELQPLDEEILHAINSQLATSLTKAILRTNEALAQYPASELSKVTDTPALHTCADSPSVAGHD